MSQPSNDASRNNSSGARYAYLRSDGTAFIVAGSAVAGLAGYAYQILGGRTLGTHDFAPVSTLLTIHFLTFIVILLPIEQSVVRRLTIARNRVGLPNEALWLGIITVRSEERRVGKECRCGGSRDDENK